MTAANEGDAEDVAASDPAPAEQAAATTTVAAAAKATISVAAKATTTTVAAKAAAATTTAKSPPPMSAAAAVDATAELTPVEWAPPSTTGKMVAAGKELNKNALMALQAAAMAAQEYDEKFTLHNASRESNVPLYLGDEMVISRDPLRQVGYYAEYQLKAVRVIVDLIEEGTFGSSIEEARNRFMERSIDGCYCAKYLQAGLLESDHGPIAAADMIIEIRILMNLSAHPNICQIYGVNQGGIDTLLEAGRKGFFMITDRITETLTDRLDAWRGKRGYDNDSGSTRFNQRLEIALDIASALIFLHNRGLVYHVRPDKVGFDHRYSRIKLYNFSQARQDGMTEHSRSITKSDDIATLAYTAPEVLCRAPGTASSDVYSFGILLWEMMSLRYPFDRYDRAMHFEQVVQNHKRPPLNRNWPDKLKQLLEGCWNPHLRFTMKAAHECLESVLLCSEEEQQQHVRTQLLNILTTSAPAPSPSPSPIAPSSGAPLSPVPRAGRPRGGGGGHQQQEHPLTPNNRSGRSARTTGSRNSGGGGGDEAYSSSPHQPRTPRSPTNANRSNRSARTAGSGSDSSPQVSGPHRNTKSPVGGGGGGGGGGRRSIRHRQSKDTNATGISTCASRGQGQQQSAHNAISLGMATPARQGGKQRRRASLDYLPSSSAAATGNNNNYDTTRGIQNVQVAPNLSKIVGRGLRKNYGAPDSIHGEDEQDDENEEDIYDQKQTCGETQGHGIQSIGGPPGQRSESMSKRVKAIRNRNISNDSHNNNRSNNGSARRNPRSVSVDDGIPENTSAQNRGTVAGTDSTASTCSGPQDMIVLVGPHTLAASVTPSVRVIYDPSNVPALPADVDIAGGDHADLDDLPGTAGHSHNMTPRAMLRKLKKVVTTAPLPFGQNKESKQQQQQQQKQAEARSPPEEYPVSKSPVTEKFRFKRRMSC